MLARVGIAVAASLTVLAAPLGAQTAPAPANAEVVGSKPATFAELMDAVDLCRRATHHGAVFEYRLLRQADYGVGVRRWEQPPGKERGELLWGFGKGNVVIFVRHGATMVSCKVVSWVESADMADKIRDEILNRKWAKTFAEGAPAALQQSMREKHPSADFKRILVGPQRLYGIDASKNDQGRDVVTVQVNATGEGK